MRLQSDVFGFAHGAERGRLFRNLKAWHNIPMTGFERFERQQERAAEEQAQEPATVEDADA